jgi:hypothetical protein
MVFFEAAVLFFAVDVRVCVFPKETKHSQGLFGVPFFFMHKKDNNP